MTSMPADKKTAEAQKGEPEPRRLLFICARNQWRSPTAERVYGSRPGVEARSAGLRSSARRRLKEADLEWADVVFTMESSHSKQIRREFPAVAGTLAVVVLDIPDDYGFMDDELVAMLLESVDGWLAENQ